MASLQWIYKELGVQTDHKCPECSRNMILFREMNMDYLACPNTKCRFLKIDETQERANNLPFEADLDIERWLILGLYHLEALAREHDTGYVSKSVWEQMMELEAKSREDEITKKMLEKIWQTKLAKSLLKCVQLEKMKNSSN